MKRVWVRGRVRELQGAAVAELIGAGQMARIAAVDAHPFFCELVLAHEGQSSGAVAGLGQRVKEWAARTIRAVARAFSPMGRVPAQIYDGLINWHGNEDSRVPVGEIVGARVIVLDGRDQAQAIGWIYPEQGALRTAILNGERDCCSIEADVVLIQEGPRLIVEDVERALAVVLGHTTRQMPGFPGAVVRALAEFGPAESQGGTESQPGQGSEPTPAPAPAPASPPGVSGPLPAAPSTPSGGLQPPLDRAAVVQLARQHGLVAADLGAPAPAALAPAPVVAPVPAPVPAPGVAQPLVATPPAQPEAGKPGAGHFDLTDPKWNPFL